MIHDLDKRSEYWRITNGMTGPDYYPIPFQRYDGHLRNRLILEIGPGDGRHARSFSDLAVAYDVADIIGERNYSDGHYCGARIRSTYTIRSYDDDLKERYDAVVFWYVVHHVLRSEIITFFEFVKRHLVSGGVALFNTTVDTGKYQGCSQSQGATCHAWPDRVCQPDMQCSVEENGIRTTSHKVDDILNALTSVGFTVIDQFGKNDFDSHVILAKVD